MVQYETQQYPEPHLIDRVYHQQRSRVLAKLKHLGGSLSQADVKELQKQLAESETRRQDAEREKQQSEQNAQNEQRSRRRLAAQCEAGERKREQLETQLKKSSDTTGDEGHLVSVGELRALCVRTFWELPSSLAVSGASLKPAVA